MKNNVTLISAKTILDSKGFSILEILIGLALIALIGGVVATNVFEQFHEGKVKTADIQMQNFAKTLKDYRRHCGSYPTTDQGLGALTQKPTGGRECKRYQPGGYLEELPLDPWDNDYFYESDGKSFKIVSFGNDLEQGGDGEDQDIEYSSSKK